MRRWHLKNSQLLDSKQSVPGSVASLALDLESVRELFNREANASTNSRKVHGQLQDCLAEDGDPNLVFDRAHQIVEEGLYDWFGNLQKIAGEFVTNLATIALGYPEPLNEDPASWARSRIKEFLDGWLDGLWSPQIVIWFHDAWGGPYLGCDEYDSWCAPTWVEKSRELTNDPANLDERITPERTEKLFRYWRRKFDMLLDHGLEQAEHTTRVNLALQRAPRAATNQVWTPDIESTIPAEGRKLLVRAGARKYRSPLKRAIRLRLTQQPNATDRRVCGWLDDEGAEEVPTAWVKNGDRTFLTVYEDPSRKHKIESMINKVRGDMRSQGLL